MTRRLDILIENARKRAEAERQQVGTASTAGDPAQVEYLVRSGVLVRCALCNKAVEPSATSLMYGNVVCDDCYDDVARSRDFQDTAPGYSAPLAEPQQGPAKPVNIAHTLPLCDFANTRCTCLGRQAGRACMAHDKWYAP